MKICIIGAGYVGMVTGVCLADNGNDVVFIDIDEEKVNEINKSFPPIYEDDLGEMLKRNSGRIKATTEYGPITEADAVFVCVGTPSRKDGSINLEYVEEAIKNIGRYIGNEWKLVVIKSTVLPGTTEGFVIPFLEKLTGKKAGHDFGVSMNPEFLREGKAIHDFKHPDRIVIGVHDKKSEELLTRLYTPFHAPLFITTLTTAEMIKYSSNALLATKISFANEIGNFCKKLGVDTYDVMEAVGMDHRISPYFLNSGAGFGGSCFPKDVRAIISAGDERGCDTAILRSVMHVNERQSLKMIELLEKHTEKLDGKKISVLGLSFKAGTDDIRESRSIPVIKKLIEKNAVISAYDPLAMENMKKIFENIDYCKSADASLKNADGCLIMTDWEEFSHLNFRLMKRPVVIDGRHIVEEKEGLIYEGICW
ncbi:MAG: UDP-glucose/GDP-mannose dehydrogenase family protein [Candidatus Thermoplasmatota archaeon]|nr:UDP-glucose/GDP-mannose dehydrogenase family protein [Candidatus Thermoplasmatota archaeon]